MAINEMFQGNALYQLIRERAGSKMVREAEQVNIYTWANECLGEDGGDAYVANQAKHFFETYPVLEIERPQSTITLSDVMKMSDKDIEELPWVYVDMLRSITTRSDGAIYVLITKLKRSPATAWREPIDDITVSNEDVFEYSYTRWYKDMEPTIKKINTLAFGTSLDDYHVAHSQAMKDRYDLVHARSVSRAHTLGREMQRRIVAFEDDWDAEAFGVGLQEYDETSYGGCGCDYGYVNGSVGDCDCDYPMPPLEPVVATLPPLPSSPVATD